MIGKLIKCYFSSWNDNIGICISTQDPHATKNSKFIAKLYFIANEFVLLYDHDSGRMKNIKEFEWL